MQLINQNRKEKFSLGKIFWTSNHLHKSVVSVSYSLHGVDQSDGKLGLFDTLGPGTLGPGTLDPGTLGPGTLGPASTYTNTAPLHLAILGNLIVLT